MTRRRLIRASLTKQTVAVYRPAYGTCLTLPAARAQATSMCTVDYSLVNSWPGGTTDNVRTYSTIDGYACNGATPAPSVQLTSPVAGADYAPGASVRPRHGIVHVKRPRGSESSENFTEARSSPIYVPWNC
jgi:hypothetical protein